MIYTEVSSTPTIRKNLHDKSCIERLKFQYGLIHSIYYYKNTLNSLKCLAPSEMRFYSVWPDTFLFRMERDKTYFAHPFIAIKTSIAINKMGALNHHLLHDWRQRCWLGSESSPKLCQQAHIFLYLQRSHLSYPG